MRKHTIFLHFLTLFVLMGFLVSGVAVAQKGPKDQFTFPKLHKIEMPSVQKAELKNGMKLLLVEDRQYPTIDLRAMVWVGSIYEPADKIGLASITGTVMRTGGTETITGDEIDQLLETLGASVETSIGQGSGYVSVSVLKEDIDKGIEILADILMHPAFRQEKIDLAKIEARSMISRRNDNIWEITGREFNSLIYGKAHPYARYPEYATIDAITRDDLVAFYKKYFHPNNIIFAAWGDFKAKDLWKKLETAFAKWPATKTDFPAKPEVDYKYKYTVNFVQKSDVNQSHIQMGHIGGMMNDPDYPALTIMNQILSYDRMFKVIRTQEGLTYAPWGYFGADYDHLGVFNCGTQTKSQSTVYAIRLILKEVKRMTEEEVTDEELARAKDTYLNGFVFNFDSKAKIVNRLMTYAYYNYPLDFIDRIKEGVEKVTKADVLLVAKKHLRPDHLQILVVGKKEDFDEPLSVLGPVNEIDITTPEPKAEAVPGATPESLQKGRELLGQAVEAAGGLAAFKAIKNVVVKTDNTITTPQGEMPFSSTVTFVLPDRFCQVLSLPFGEVVQVMVGDLAWVAGPQGTQDLPESQKKEMKAGLFRDIISLFRNSDSDALQVQYLGEEKVEGTKANVVLLSDVEGNTTKMFLDAKTYLPIKQAYRGTTMTGPAELEELFSDYREVAGIKIPFRTLINANGQKYVESTVTEFKINTEVDPKLFQK